ncbi:30S ribosomal protein S13 [Candidatus Woesearchaeota archaeon]|nr:30S ribosomal protein S13 [Candidatus Woesearchaeota archaeon]
MAEQIRQMVRILNSDIAGAEPIEAALRNIKGIGFSFSSAACNIFGCDKRKKIGLFTDEEIKKFEDIIKNPTKYGIPTWMLNRRKDYDTGKDLHLTQVELKLSREFDIKNMKKIRCYKGIRHSYGLPVRGQKTKAHFRTGRTLGVKKKVKVGKT